MTDTIAPKKRATWTHQEVAALVKDFHSSGGKSIGGAGYNKHSPSEVRAKLIELGLIEKPEPEVLDAEVARDIETFVAEIAVLSPKQSILAAREAIGALRTLLPKRAPKAGA